MCYCMCSDVMCASHGTCMQASWPPYVYVVHQKLLMDMPFMPAKLYLSKLTTSHFGTLNMRIANQNMLNRILIAMHNENKADCNENFRICLQDMCRGTCSTSVQAVGFNRPVGMELLQLQVYFWSILDS